MGRWSDLVSRARTVVIAVPVVIAVAAWAPAEVWAVLVGVAALAAAWECLNLLSRGTKPLVAGAGAKRTATTTILSVVFVAFFCGLLPAHLALLRRDAGSAWTLLVIAVAWGGDVAGYLVGKAVGGPRLAPSISPGKTIAGAVAGLVTALAAGLVFLRVAPQPEPSRLLWVVAAAGVLSQVGDLAESLLKRRCGAKDSGAVIPGSGGVLDCLDGLILAAPWMFYAHRFFF